MALSSVRMGANAWQTSHPNDMPSSSGAIGAPGVDCEHLLEEPGNNCDTKRETWDSWETMYPSLKEHCICFTSVTCRGLPLCASTPYPI